MLDLDSAEVMKLQQDYLQAILDNDVVNIRLNKQKLVNLGFSLVDLKSLVRSQQPSGMLTIRYPETGYLQQMDVVPGQTLNPQQRIGVFKPAYALTAVARVFESQWTWLKPGQKVIMSNRAHPGVQWQGEVRKVDELGNSSTTSVKLEADFEASDEVELRLGMQTEMDVFTESRADALQVPTPAVIYYGTRSLVVIDRGDGHFQPVDVRTGLRNEEYTEILSGVDETMKVVVSGQFLIDSASSLEADLTRLDSGEQEHGH
jgi:Cu(I)/Ag(I) efflux system membrane fusion protein